jgi:DNA-binding response OmpR family regulator
MVKPSPPHLLIVPRSGFCCTAASRAKAFASASLLRAQRRWNAWLPACSNLVTLDLQLPDGDGFAVGREIRARSAVPIIMVTGKGNIIDRVVGL